MNRTKWIVVATFAFAVLSAMHGKAQEYRYDLTPEEGIAFDKVILKGNMPVVLVPGETGAVWIQYDNQRDKDRDKDRVSRGLTLNHHADSLYLVLELDQGKRWQKQTVFVQYAGLESIESSRGVVLSNEDTIRVPALDITGTGTSGISLVMNVNELNTRFSGANRVVLSGRADHHRMIVSGVTSLNASNLKTLNMSAVSSGASRVNIYVTDSLRGTLSGTSHLSNKAEPAFFDVEATGLAILSIMNDTTRVQVNQMEIIIPENKKAAENRDEVVGAVYDELIKRERGRKKFKGNWGGVSLGANGFLNTDHEFNAPPQGYDFLKLNEQKSLVVNINLFQKNVNLIRNRFGLVTGLGLQYNNYRFQSNTVLSGDSAQIYGYLDTDPDKNYIKSKLLAKYITVPVLLEYNTDGRKGFHIGAGAQFAWMYGSHSKIVYEHDRSRKKVKDKGDFHLSPYKADLMVRVGWNWVNMFATYSITEMFRDDRGPRLHPFTIGIHLASW